MALIQGTGGDEVRVAGNSARPGRGVVRVAAHVDMVANVVG